jgi:predicted ribonuclease YlaK
LWYVSLHLHIFLRADESVITELHGLGNNAGSLGDSAKSAMIAINKIIAERKDVKIITAKGSDVTKAGFFREKLEKDDDDETRNIDDVIIRTTREQAQSRRQAFAERGVIGYNAETAILLTEDTNMRVKANARGVPAISTTILKRFLVQLSGGTGARQQKKTQPSAKAGKRKSVAPPIMTRIKNEYDDEMDDLPMVDVPDPHSAPKTKAPPKRRMKRGRTTEDTQQYAQAR